MNHLKSGVKIFLIWFVTLVTSLIISATNQAIITPQFKNALAASSFLVLFVMLILKLFKTAKSAAGLLKALLICMAVILIIITMLLVVGIVFT